MKKILMATLIVLSFVHKSYGIACMICQDPGIPFVDGCATAQSAGCDDSGNGTEYFTCNTCMSGYTRTQITSPCGYIYICEQNCTGCTDCTDTPWTTISAGYQRYTTATCNCNSCYYSYTYRCAANYYGTTYTGTSGCTSCPMPGTSIAGANSAITNCFLPAASIGEDSLGSYTYTQACYYTN